MDRIFFSSLRRYFPGSFSAIASACLAHAFVCFNNSVNHLDIEIYPKKFHKHFAGKWLIGATHHSLHHKQFKYNFGLYFTFWDKWKKTESPLYDKLFEEKTAPRVEAIVAVKECDATERI